MLNRFARLQPVKVTLERIRRALPGFQEFVEHRRRGGEQGDYVLSLLLAARHEDGSPLSEVELRDELVTMLVAGHETTASQLAWAVAILARFLRRKISGSSR